MNRAHCDICDQVIIDYETSCSVTCGNSYPHIAILKSGSQAEYCLDCFKVILKSLLAKYESQK